MISNKRPLQFLLQSGMREGFKIFFFKCTFIYLYFYCIFLKFISQFNVPLFSHIDLLEPQETTTKSPIKKPPLLGLLSVCGTNSLLLWFRHQILADDMFVCQHWISLFPPCIFLQHECHQF